MNRQKAGRVHERKRRNKEDRWLKLSQNRSEREYRKMGIERRKAKQKAGRKKEKEGMEEKR